MPSPNTSSFLVTFGITILIRKYVGRLVSHATKEDLDNLLLLRAFAIPMIGIGGLVLVELGKIPSTPIFMAAILSGNIIYDWLKNITIPKITVGKE